VAYAALAAEDAATVGGNARTDVTPRAAQRCGDGFTRLTDISKRS
jgi:hypothetical protein